MYGHSRYENPIKRGQLGGRPPPAGTRVQAYRNLNVHDQIGWSVRDAKTGLVIAIVAEVILEDASLKVSDAGRLRVLRDKRKNVHAWADGLWAPKGPPGRAPWERIRYNPYVFSSFVRASDESPLAHVQWVKLSEDGAFAVLDAGSARGRRKNPATIHHEAYGEIDTWNGLET